jgi:D-aminopeptidase
MQLFASSLNNVVIATKHNEVSNVVDAKLLKYARLVSRYGFIADVQ